MPAQTFSRSQDVCPALGHVNLMVDTLIANAKIDDLRSIVRGLLATQPPTVTTAFTGIARTRLQQMDTARVYPNASSFFVWNIHSSSTMPTQQLHDTLTRIRSLYGAGLGFASISALVPIIRATIGLRWESNGVMADILAVIDADIGQAIQSSKEEIEGSRVRDIVSARGVVSDLRVAVNESLADTRSWGGEFPFERAVSSIQYWKI
ncbi:hypothetical protein L208DRAFT_1386536 [Tricholoma matsutake]|nr:hypothetical protein L208DRAFT_1386536 [Tricholoma matsutake 945]